jgi:hypothetical protein
MPKGEPPLKHYLSGKREPNVGLAVYPGNKNRYEKVALSKRGRRDLEGHLPGLGDDFLYLSTIFLISIFICQGATPVIEGQKDQDREIRW